MDKNFKVIELQTKSKDDQAKVMQKMISIIIGLRVMPSYLDGDDDTELTVPLKLPEKFVSSLNEGVRLAGNFVRQYSGDDQKMDNDLLSLILSQSIKLGFSELMKNTIDAKLAAHVMSALGWDNEKIKKFTGVSL